MTNDELDEYATEYQNTNDSKHKNRLFKKIYKKYEPYIKNRCIGMSKQDSEDVLQLYSMQILIALVRWEHRASFSTYLFSNIRGTIKEWVRTHKNKMFREDRYHILVGDMDTIGEQFLDKIYYGYDMEMNYTKKTQVM